MVSSRAGDHPPITDRHSLPAPAFRRLASQRIHLHSPRIAMSEPPSFSPDKSDPTHVHRDGSGTDPEGSPSDGEMRDGILQTVMYTDIENSASLTGTLGDRRYAKIQTRRVLDVDRKSTRLNSSHQL